MHSSKLRIFLNVNSVKCNLIRQISATNSLAKIDKEITHLKSWREIPGPSSLPFIGQIHHFLPGGEFHNLTVGSIWEKMHDQYGPIAKLELMFTPPTILVTDPDSIQQVLHAENYMPRRPGLFSFDYYRRHYKNKDGQTSRHIGLITDYGEQWKVFRSTVNQIMLQPNSLVGYNDTINNIARDNIARLKSLRNENNMIPDFHTQVKLWSLESIGYIATGCQIQFFDQNLKENRQAKRLAEILNELLSNQTMFMDFIMPVVWKYLPTRTFQQVMSTYKEMEQIAQHYIHIGMEELKKNPNRNNAEKSLLEKLLEKDEEVALILACDMMAAGFHSVANSVISLLYQLSKNQDKQQKLRESFTSNEPKVYLKACIKESMRMLPITSSNARITTNERNILGYKVPKYAIVLFNHGKLISDENQFRRPSEFIPERWIVGKEDPLHHGNAHPFASLPFGFGVRTCIGRRIADMELEAMLYHVIANFKVEWQGPPPVVKRELVNTLEGLSFVLNDVKE